MNRSLAEAPIFDRLSVLGDTTRSRILLLLERNEFTVSELCQALQLPQSTVSRHLKVLSEDGWVSSRAEGTSRHYRIRSPLEDPARGLWRIVRDQVRGSRLAEEDGERARSVLSERLERSREFFASSAGRWDALRDELFGSASELVPLFGLLDPAWTVGDLGCGTGRFAARVAPFVERVIGVDRSPAMLGAARDRLGDRPGVSLRQGELEALPVEDGELDLAVLLLVLHYVGDPARALSEAGRALRPGGGLLLVDMRSHGRRGYREEMGHLWPGFAPDELEGWLLDAGFDTFGHRPAPPDPEAKGPPLFVATARLGGSD